MSEYIHKSHHVTVLLYHLVFPEKYRRVVFDKQVDAVLKDVCLGVAERYQVKFLEIGTDKDPIYFLVQSMPTYSMTKLVTLIKRITTRKIFKRCPQVKKKLALDWEQRKQLRAHPLAQSLHALYSSHRKPFSLKLETLQAYTGSRNKKMRGFKSHVQKALTKLVEVGFLLNFKIKGDLAHVERALNNLKTS